MPLIPINSSLSIDEDEITLSFIRSGGPGGQNVNKLSTAVQLRFDVRRSPSLPGAVRARCETVAGSRLTKDGVIVITANRLRTQDANRRDALVRLVELIRQAAVKPKFRVRTRVSPGIKKRRRQVKARRSEVKARRSGRISSED